MLHVGMQCNVCGLCFLIIRIRHFVRPEESDEALSTRDFEIDKWCKIRFLASVQRLNLIAEATQHVHASRDVVSHPLLRPLILTPRSLGVPPPLPIPREPVDGKRMQCRYDDEISRTSQMPIRMQDLS